MNVQDSRPTVKVRALPGKLELEASVDVACSPRAAWDVVADYDRLGAEIERRAASRQGDRRGLQAAEPARLARL